MVNPGRFRERLTVQARTLAKSAGGFQAETWTAVQTNPTYRARVRTITRRLVDRSGRVITDNAVEVVGWYRSDITVRDHRFLWGSTPLEIVAIEDQSGDRRQLRFTCEMVPA